MDINVEAVGALGKSNILKELKGPMGYLTADKLNDVQAGKLYENMLKLDEFYNPRQVSNITDLATGTRDLTAEGLGSLRTRTPTKKMIDDAIEDASPGFANDRKVDAELVAENLAQRMGLVYDDLPTKQRLDLYDKAFQGLSKQRFGDLPPPGSRGGPEDIAAPFQSAEETIRQLRIQDPDLADQVRKMVDQGIMSVGNRGDIPIKRANAREFLVEALKKDTLDPKTSGFGRTNLNDVVSAEDVKFITEGGGGLAGDPLFLVEKYFGPAISKLIPSEKITPRFIERLLTNVEDAAGRRPDDPRFDRFTAKLIDEDIPFAKGGLAKILEV